MKTYDFTNKNDDNTACFYIDSEGGICDTEIEANRFIALDGHEMGQAQAKIIVHGFFVGSIDDMRENALELYNNRSD